MLFFQDLHCLNWHARGTGFDTGKVALNLTINLYLPKRKLEKYRDVFTHDLKMNCCQSFYWGWDDWLGKKRDHCFEGSVGKMAVNLSLLKRDGTSWDVAALVTILAVENELQWKRHIQLTSFSPVVLNITPPLRGDCNTGQWETHLQMRNKEVCFAYQLLTTSWLAFGCCCCLWFWRCMPSYGSRVMDPFPRKLHWNILTVTFS